ncbi:MAG: DinB family protein [Flavobacteriaceae bacterium]|nr:DinB family protein [Flavobacteriaceae bacterium]
MTHQFEIAKLSRNVLLGLTKNLTEVQYNNIPKGFNNNIAWNLGHILVTQQLLVHKLSDVACVVDKTIIKAFGKGSVPRTDYTLAEIENLKSQMHSAVETTKDLFNRGSFKTFNVYPTSLGYTINNVKDAIAFSNYHEGMHVGIIMALKKLV